MTTISEKDIVLQLKSSDWKRQNRAFKILYELYYYDLYNFVRQYLKSSESSREIAHDAFVKLWLHREHLDETRSVKAYLFTISKNSLVKEFHRQMKNPRMRDYLDFAHSLSAEAKISYDYDTYIQLIEDAKKLLTPRQLQLFILNKEENTPVKLIAEELQIQEQVVRNQLSAAIKKVREYINNQINEGFVGKI